MKNLMKTIGAVAVVLGMAATAQATLYTWASGFANGGVIPDGSTTGWSDTRTLSGLADTITDVNVVLNISGGYNGDLYGYLVHSSGFCVLLDRVGTGTGSEPQYSFGFSTSGFSNVTLDADSVNGSIHDILDPTGGTYTPDNTSGSLTSFNGLDPNGSWTLFLADLSGGDTSTMVSWGLDITAVPEPITWALMLFGGTLGSVKLVRVWRARRKA